MIEMEQGNRVENRITSGGEKMDKRIAYCTITSANYLGRVKIFADALERHNPGAKLFILLCEHPSVCKEFSEKLNFSFYSPADIGCPDWLQMAFYYSIREFNTALKPFFLQRLIENGYQAIFYFDPDIEIYGSLKEMEDLVPDFDIVLTPHICKPPLEQRKQRPVDEFLHPTEPFIRAGQFNLGYMGISSSAESRELLRWWQQVCTDKCHCEKIEDYFIYFFDQFWASLFPSFIEKTFILRDSTYNVAYWNIFQRELQFKDGRWFVDGKALQFFHFSGLALVPGTTSDYRYPINASLDDALNRIISEYVDKVINTDWHFLSSYPYSFGRYSNNETLTDAERRAYHRMRSADRVKLDNPFSNAEKLRAIDKSNLDFNLMTNKIDRNPMHIFSHRSYQGMSFLAEREGVTLSGMGILEGPYPEWDLPRVRWAKNPRATIEFDIIDENKFDSVVLSMSFRPHVRPSAQMTVKFNGAIIKQYNIAGWENWHDDKLSLQPRKGRNVVEFSFEGTAGVSPPPDSLYMLFRELSLRGIKHKRND